MEFLHTNNSLEKATPFDDTGNDHGAVDASVDSNPVTFDASTENSSVERPNSEPKDGMTDRKDDPENVSVARLMLAISGLGVVMLAQRGGSLKNIKTNLSKQGKANAKKPMSPEQKKLRRRKRKR